MLKLGGNSATRTPLPYFFLKGNGIFPLLEDLEGNSDCLNLSVTISRRRKNVTPEARCCD